MEPKYRYILERQSDTDINKWIHVCVFEYHEEAKANLKLLRDNISYNKYRLLEEETKTSVTYTEIE